MFVGVLICENFSNMSSLKERARRANFVPLRLFLCPDVPLGGVLEADGELVSSGIEFSLPKVDVYI